jgi:hypothetical protein
MRCKTFLRRYDRSDAGRGMSALMLLHAARCSSCMSETDGVAYSIEMYRAEGSGAESAEKALEDRVMSAVRHLPPPKQEISIREWFAAGFIIVASMALIPLGEDFNSFKLIFGRSFALPLSLVLGGVATVYMSLFIASHIDVVGGFLKRRMGHS